MTEIALASAEIWCGGFFVSYRRRRRSAALDGDREPLGGKRVLPLKEGNREGNVSQPSDTKYVRSAARDRMIPRACIRLAEGGFPVAEVEPFCRRVSWQAKSRAKRGIT
jgi:hypothetical protein